ncbi:hypothetical protein Zm00014a_016166 [Zea mays]|uniref:Uncharacterized protein n=1 Tax=Zea mays TaxID=4577 RepID=A0A317YFP1_MAIZE|nr:hypothetical protein Zm00014a_016166 [Zea mays]
MAHRSFSGPPEATSPPLSPLCPWIHGLFPAIELAVAPSSPLPNSSDPGATLAHACLNYDDLTTAERSGTARSHLFSLDLISPPSNSDRTARTAGYCFTHACLTRPVPHVSATRSRSSFPV